jgi:hypothetical protein
LGFRMRFTTKVVGKASYGCWFGFWFWLFGFFWGAGGPSFIKGDIKIGPQIEEICTCSWATPITTDCTPPILAYPPTVFCFVAG